METGIFGSRLETLVESEAVWLIRELPWAGIAPFLSAMEELQVADKAKPAADEPKAPREAGRGATSSDDRCWLFCAYVDAEFALSLWCGCAGFFG